MSNYDLQVPFNGDFTVFCSFKEALVRKLKKNLLYQTLSSPENPYVKPKKEAYKVRREHPQKITDSLHKIISTYEDRFAKWEKEIQSAFVTIVESLGAQPSATVMHIIIHDAECVYYGIPLLSPNIANLR